MPYRVYQLVFTSFIATVILGLLTGNFWIFCIAVVIGVFLVVDG